MPTEYEWAIQQPNVTVLPKTSECFVSWTDHGAHRSPEWAVYDRVWAHGDRTPEAAAWTTEAAYTTDERPPETPACQLPNAANFAGTSCRILFGDLPRCGHEFCYGCLRERFNTTFVCMTCGKLVMRPLEVKDSVETQQRRAAYYAEKYGWVDKSEVTYDFTGLTFPRRDLMYLDNEARRFKSPERVYPEWEPSHRSLGVGMD
uniref:RING-type domain-containing protein n=1 Tax=Mycena chlorophos TaxID=658473 RepID=A0ABQ0LMV2_MYCCL|nr:predicted protein [Mycena chlorophos]